jgi:hypothetical protein
VISPAARSVAARAAAIPAQAGIGLRTPHVERILRERPPLAWLEAHSENYFQDGGAQVEKLAQARALYPLSLHGVGLSLGSADPIDIGHLRKLDRLVRWSEPAFVSEHLSWASIGGEHFNDLLPLPYTEEALRLMVARVAQVQDFIGRRILIENVSSYLRFEVGSTQLKEWDFLAALAAEADCGLLVDVNNIYVSACNHGFDPHDYLAALPPQRVMEMHLAGHTAASRGGRRILIDTHSTPVCAEVWRLYEHALERFGPLPTLIEWDLDLPELGVLIAEADRADRTMELCCGLVA